MKRIGDVLYYAVLVIAGTVLGLVIGYAVGFLLFLRNSDGAPGDGLLMLAIWFVTVPAGIAAIILFSRLMLPRIAARRIARDAPTNMPTPQAD